MRPLDWFRLKAAREKTDRIEAVLQVLLESSFERDSPDCGIESLPGRDVAVMGNRELPPKPKLSSFSGQTRLLHDLANIEMQAMELAVRTLFEFPEAPRDFRSELSEIALEEAKHFRLCLDRLEEMGEKWAAWPVNAALWENAPDAQRGLLYRVFVVHRHMEGSGLDAGAAILTRLSGVGPTPVREPVERIVRDEIGHVQFGSRWYRRLCLSEGLNPDDAFEGFFSQTLKEFPRTEKPSFELRREAGFSEIELSAMADVLSRVDYSKPRAESAGLKQYCLGRLRLEP